MLLWPVPFIPPHLLARLLFPHEPPHLQRRHFTQLLLALTLGLVAALATAGFIIFAPR